MSTYADFLDTKRPVALDHGFHVDDSDIHESLFDFQRAITKWAIRKGRAAVFADTGLGKTRMQVEWARLSGQRALILAPLAVAHQTVAEAARMGVTVGYAHDEGEATERITITNYERLHKFDLSAYGAVVLDESSILKAFSGTTKRALVAGFKKTPWRLACTATPAPNDIEELTNHADFLGIMSPQEMRSTFFIADNRGEFMRYRLKNHARATFYRWLSSWAMAVRRPSDLGFDDARFELPGLDIFGHIVDTEWRPDDRLFALELKGVTEQAQVRQATLVDRVERAVSIINAEPNEAWLVWCGMNAESKAVTAQVAGAVEVEGSQDGDVKAARLLDFAEGRTRVMVTKTSLAGFGLNFQQCARMVFVGIGYSYEQYYQALRRCYRFGQTRRVEAHIVLAEQERPILAAVQAKERHAQELSSGLLAEVRDYERAELLAGTSAGDDYEPRAAIELPDWMRSA